MRSLGLLKAIARSIKQTVGKFVFRHRFFDPVRNTYDTASPISPTQLLSYHWRGKFGPYWPVHPTSLVVGSWANVHIGIDVTPGSSPGCYIQGIGTIRIGDYTWIAPQVGIISANHDFHDMRNHIPGHVEIGRYCWLGIRAVILPNVVLGDYTIVAAGAVVTKSFPRGYVVIGGSPAKVLRQIEPDECVYYENSHKYHGFLSETAFKEIENTILNPFFRNNSAHHMRDIEQ